MIKRLAGVAAVVLGIAGIGADEASARQELCADPAAVCAARLDGACLQKLGAGALAIGDETCRSQLEDYSQCLEQAAAECGRPAPEHGPAAIEPFSLRCQVKEVETPGVAPQLSHLPIVRQMKAATAALMEEYSRSPEYSVLDQTSIYDWQIGQFIAGYVAEDTIMGNLGGKWNVILQIQRTDGSFQLNLIHGSTMAEAFGDCEKIEFRPVEKKRAF